MIDLIRDFLSIFVTKYQKFPAFHNKEFISDTGKVSLTLWHPIAYTGYDIGK